MSKELVVPKATGRFVKQIDAAIALLTHVKSLATADGAAPKSAKQPSANKQVKRSLSADAREAIAVAQRKRWAKIKRQKKQADRAALAK
jgi:hypothetical protein